MYCDKNVIRIFKETVIYDYLVEYVNIKFVEFDMSKAIRKDLKKNHLCYASNKNLTCHPLNS